MKGGQGVTQRIRQKEVTRQAVESCLSDPLFSGPRLSELILSVGAPLVAAPADIEPILRELTYSFALERRRETMGDRPPSDAELKRFVAACDTILSMTGCDQEISSASIDPKFGQFGLYRAAIVAGAANGQTATLDALRGVVTLRRDALFHLVRNARVRKSIGKPPERAIKTLVTGLADLYREAWGTIPTVVRNAGKEEGPVVRMSFAVHDALRKRGADNCVRTAGALAKIYERSGDYEFVVETRHAITAIDQRRV